MEGRTPTQQQDEEQNKLVGCPGPTQRLSSGGGATGSVEEGTVHGNTLATVSASSSRSVQFARNLRRLTEIIDGRVDGGTGLVGILAHHQAEKEGIQLGTTTSKPTPLNIFYSRNVTKSFPGRNLGGSYRRVEGVRISRTQGRGGNIASLQFLTVHNRRPRDR